MRLRILACLLAFAVCAEAWANDLYADINRTRAGEGDCAVSDRLPALIPRAALEQAARELARGGDLQNSLNRAGYRSTRSRALTVTGGDGVGEQAIAVLARQRFCPQLMDAGLTEVGIYRDERLVWIVMAAPFAPPVGVAGETAGLRVLDLINQARATPRYCGNRAFSAARPVRWNNSLAVASRLHSEDMARYNYFGHNGSDGSAPAQRVERAGYRYRATGENIAAGQMKPEDAVAGWIKSPSHCSNLMNPVYTDMGAAFAVNAKSEMGVYWTQAFGTPR
jgi:uncharacterized protein YkwD